MSFIAFRQPPLIRFAFALLLTISGFSATAANEKPIAKLLQPYVDKQMLAGAVTLVADKEKIIDLEAVGYMDVAAKKPMRTDCMFWIASQSKPITTTALMILVDEGKVNVNDPVEKYLPEFKGQMVVAEQDANHVLLKKPVHPILVRNVLNHTSGLTFKTPLEQPTLDLFPLAARVSSYAMTPLQFEPDSKYQYSNAGINTAGRIIEVVSGMPYEKFLETRIFQPLGMKDTTFWPTSSQIRRLAKSYKPGKNGLEEVPIEQLHYPLNDPARQPMPAGGLFSTAKDLSIFYRMLANGGEWNGKRIVSEAAVKQLMSKQTGDLATPYGFGFNTGGGRVGHNGAYGTSSGWDAEHGVITIYLVQHAVASKEFKAILPEFIKAATEKFGKQ